MGCRSWPTLAQQAHVAGGGRGRHPSPWQIGIDVEVEPKRAPLDSAQHQVLKARAGKVDEAKTARLVELLDEVEGEGRGRLKPNEAEALTAEQALIAMKCYVAERKTLEPERLLRRVRIVALAGRRIFLTCCGPRSS